MGIRGSPSGKFCSCGEEYVYGEYSLVCPAYEQDVENLIRKARIELRQGHHEEK